MSDLASRSGHAGLPYAVTDPDRIPKERYYDKAFYELELKHLWPRTWQMACRLEEIPSEGDYSVYRNVGLSAIVIRTGPDEIKAYDNACRHRGVELVNSRGKAKGGFVCPFHGWRWNTAGESTWVYAHDAFAADQMCEADLRLTELKVEVWGGCVFVNWDKDAPGFRENLGRFGDSMDLFQPEDLRAEWWLSARLPCNWKLAMEAFMEGYHVATTHQSLSPKGVTNHPDSARWFQTPPDMVIGSLWQTFPPQMPEQVTGDELMEQMTYFMRNLREGMSGMVAAEEIEVLESLRGKIEVPSDPAAGMLALRRQLNDAMMAMYRGRGIPIGDFNAIDEKRLATFVNFAFPHFFLLPVWGAAASYRIRPLGPEECLFEIWSLKRYAPGEEPPLPPIPEPMAHDDPRWPRVPTEDFTNLPKQQRGLHNPGFEFMRLSDQMEGLVSNFHRSLDRFLAGAEADRVGEALRRTSGPIEVPCQDF